MFTLHLNDSVLSMIKFSDSAEESLLLLIDKIWKCYKLHGNLSTFPTSDSKAQLIVNLKSESFSGMKENLKRKLENSTIVQNHYFRNGTDDTKKIVHHALLLWSQDNETIVLTPIDVAKGLFFCGAFW